MSALRINLILSATAGLVAAFMQTGCAHSPSVWHYYDECAGAGENQSFVVMAECGRKKRLAECGANNSCSPEGNVFVEYIDSLAQSVKDKKMTEAEALRRYAEYKSGGTSRCTQVGNTTKCY
jgi:hypothetical protein